MYVKAKEKAPPARTGGGDHGQMPPTPACPVRQHKQMAMPKGK